MGEIIHKKTKIFVSDLSKDKVQVKKNIEFKVEK